MNVFQKISRLPPRLILVFGLAGALMAGILAYGLRAVDWSFNTRAQNEDARRVGDLRHIILLAEQVYLQEGALPPSLDEIESKAQRRVPAADPFTFEIYGYKVTGPSTFAVCATFATSNMTTSNVQTVRIGDQDIPLRHEAGGKCFEVTLPTS
jgi:hypothetical protein